MGDRPSGVESPLSSLHHVMLEKVLGSKEAATDALVYSYGKSFNAFAARLSEDEAQTLSEMDGVVSVFPDTVVQLHTTRSWDFMGYPQSHSGYYPTDSDVVIGMIDTGIWPESKSFSDEGFAPPPERFKGICQSLENFTCTNKIIGARYYNSYNSYTPVDYKSARDSVGHGTHTSSIAAGLSVANASYYGLAQGTARGGAPGARIAVYKVCWSWAWYLGCPTVDILAAFEDAIADGVDIISISMNYLFPTDYFEDVIAIGSFHAMKKGILTSNSAGNLGPGPMTVNSVAPWALSVAASTIDRRFATQVVLGNGLVFTGNSVNSFTMNGTTFPLIYGGDAVNVSAGSARDFSGYCLPDTLNANKVSGKIVLCDLLSDTSGVLIAGGVGTIMTQRQYRPDEAFNFPIPATAVRIDDASEILDYIQSSENPTATILYSNTWKDIAAPVVTSFSARGPNSISPDILKPDITAPGNDILGAWAPVVPATVYWDDYRPVDYNVISGTSMSCPHASGAAAYVKSFHPSWSGSAVKSALMTTALRMDPIRHEDAEFAYGAGHINPVRAKDPGLVYDAGEKDFVEFLCSQGYNLTLIRLISGDNTTSCPDISQGKAWDLNYPSMTLRIEDGKPVYGYFTRTVTNVGLPNTTYYSYVSAPSKIKISIEPSILSFTNVGEKKSFVVKVNGGILSQHPIISSFITWKDQKGLYEVRSPLIVYTSIPTPQASIYSNHQILGTKKKQEKKQEEFSKRGGMHRFPSPIDFDPFSRAHHF
ncbi:subtilisin-like protease SBT4.3 [Amborella trichopoda]|uniref:subtilisin-like protease SBT4.3 n=1 Tax=Amborella trichopoda TaxID=13333 RepID=UPI0009C14AAC|nr:subtilisin-like protease SBT4.3 [Amborella trichopoda]|eukprot:XP_011626025.2 subtilisin-like protease SBT4.3 [Amborella trichopoda]